MLAIREEHFVRIADRREKHYPPFLAMATHVLDRCFDECGALYWVTRGYASYAEQTALWRQGRYTPGINPTPKRPLGFTVTDALGGYSSHNFGLALDVAYDKLPDVPKLQPEWDLHRFQDPLGFLCDELGLIWGGYFARKDGPHFQWPGYVTGSSLQLFRDVLRRTGDLGAVWRLLDDEVNTPKWQQANPALHATLIRIGAMPSARRMVVA